MKNNMILMLCLIGLLNAEIMSSGLNLVVEAQNRAKELILTSLVNKICDFDKDVMIRLKVVVPESYSLITQVKDGENIGMLEFIPTGQVVDSWSEIIVAQAFIDYIFSSDSLIDQIIVGLKVNATNVNVLKLFNKQFEHYLMSSALVQYRYKEREEVVFLSYFSSPICCSGFQYTIALSDTMTVEMAKEKMQKFMENNIAMYMVQERY